MSPEDQAVIAEWAAQSKRSRPWETLQDALEELERTDPEVGAAARRYDEMVHEVTQVEPERQRRWARINERRAAEGKPPIGPYERQRRAMIAGHGAPAEPSVDYRGNQ